MSRAIGNLGRRLICQSPACFQKYILSHIPAELKRCVHLPRISARVSESATDQFEKEDFVAKRHPGVLPHGNVCLPAEFTAAAKILLEKHVMKNLEKSAKELEKYIKSRRPPIESKEYRNICEKIENEVRGEDVILEPFLSEKELKILEQRRFDKTRQRVKRSVYHWEAIDFTGANVTKYLMVRSAAEYAVLYRIFSEMAIRDPDFQPQSHLDFGSGIATASWAANAFWNESLNEHLLVDASRDMSDLAELILRGGNHNATMKFKNIFFRQFLPTSAARQYDIVTCAYSLFELSSAKERINILNTLWRKCSKYMVIVEYGAEHGFQLINEARDFVLRLDEDSKSKKNKCHVFSPCPHELLCPKYAKSLLPCKFQVKYRSLLPFGKEIIKKENYTYIVLKRGRRKEDTWPRLVEKPLVRPRHVICRLCMPNGNVSEAVFTKAKSAKNLYRSARKSHWGDLLPVEEVPPPPEDTEFLDVDAENTVANDNELSNKTNT